VAFDGAGAPGEAEPAGDGVLVGSQAGDEGAERGLAGGECGGHPWLEQFAAAALVHDDGEVADAGGDGGQFRGCGEDGVEAGLVGVGEPVGPGHDPGGHGACLRRGRGPGGDGCASAEAREVAADLPAASLVSAGADLLPQQRGVGAAGVPSLVQVGCVLVEDAGPPAGAVADEQLFGAGGAGEPADGVAGQAQRGGDLAEAASAGQHPVHVGVPAPRPVRDPPAARDGGRRGRLRCRRGGSCSLRGGRCRQVLPVPGNRALHRLAEVVP
jgi:hypothetical protein